LEPLCTVPPADGAFYCFIRVNAAADPMQIAERLIREFRVAVIPGTAFGVTDGCYFRVAYGALQKDTVAEGIGRLVTGLRALVGRRIRQCGGQLRHGEGERAGALLGCERIAELVVGWIVRAIEIADPQAPIAAVARPRHELIAARRDGRRRRPGAAAVRGLA